MSTEPRRHRASRLLRLSSRLCAEEIVRSAYRGILKREADPQGLAVYARRISDSADLASVLGDLSTSDEHRRAMFADQSLAIVRALRSGISGDLPDKCPDDTVVERCAGGLAQPDDLAPVVRRLLHALTASREHQSAVFATQARPIARALCRGMLGDLPDDQPDDATLDAYAVGLAQPDDLSTLARRIGGSDPHWRRQLDSRAATVVRGAVDGLLGREPDEAELQAGKAALTGSDGIAALLAPLASSDELWQRLLRARAPELVADALQGLLGTPADAVTRDAIALPFGAHLDVRALFESIAASGLLWHPLVARHAGRLVDTVHTALLGSGSAPAERAECSTALARTGDLGRLLGDTAASDRHWARMVESRAPELVAAVHDAMLGRAPTPAEFDTGAALLGQAGGIGRLVAAIGGGDELFWQRLLPARAPRIAALATAALLGDAADASAIATPGALAGPEDLARWFGEVGRSDALWHQLFATRRDVLLAAVRAALLGEPAPQRADPADGDAVGMAVAGFAAAVVGIVESAEFGTVRLARQAGDLIGCIYRALLGREPDAAGLASYTARLVASQDIAALLAVVANSDEHRRLIARTAPPAPTAPASPPVVPGASPLPPPPAASRPHLALFKDLSTAAGIVLVDGWHPVESDGFSWSTRRSTLVIGGPVRLFITANVRPDCACRIRIDWGRRSRTIAIEDSFGFTEMSFDVTAPTTVSFEVLSDDPRLHADPRELAFQLWPQRPPNHYAARPAGALAPCAPVGAPATTIFVHAGKKERDALAPVHAAWRAAETPTPDSPPHLLSIGQAIEFCRQYPGAALTIVIASATAYALLDNAGIAGRFVYLEHGVAPLKRYTYGAHYRRYHHVLLPGDLWRERLESLYPEVRGRCATVGFPKLDVRPATAADRLTFCGRFGLDPSRDIVLFAPSWSGGQRGRGIHNIDGFDRSTNLLAVPHDADARYAGALRTDGWNVHLPGEGESISAFYPFADVLVSDVSSTAIEFMALGKPALCLKTTVDTDFDPQFQDADLGIAIPYTDARWNFCPQLDKADLDAAVRRIFAGQARAVPTPVPELVTRMCACFGEQATARSVQVLRDILIPATATEAQPA